MAADGERRGFKSFVVRRKAEYSLRFPFLTERQILAKLRKVWESQKNLAPSKSRKRDEPAIQLPHAAPSLPIPPHSKVPIRHRSDLSAFDVDTDLCKPPIMRPQSKCCYSMEQQTKSTASTGSMCTAAPCSTHCSSCHQGDTPPMQCATENTDQRAPLPALPDGNNQRRPLEMPANSHKLRNNVRTDHPIVCQHCSEASCTCRSLRKEAKCCRTNTLPFASGPALRDQNSVVSMGTEETLAPSMARQTAGNNLKHTLRVGVPCRDGTACHAQQTLSSHNTLWDADSERIDTDQSSRQGPHDENPTVPPSCVHPAGKSTVPSSSCVAPSVDASLDRGVGLAPGLLVSTFADENSRCNGFGSDSRYSSATRVPSDESDTTPRDCSGHFTSCDATGGEASPTKLLPFPGVPSSSGNESHFQRRCRSRRRVRARNFWTRNVEPCLSDHEGGAKEVQCTKGRRTCIQLVASHRIHGNSELIRGSAVGRTPCIENRRKLSNDINTHGVTDENSSFEVSSATFSGKQARSLQQIVPAQSQLNPSSWEVQKTATITTTAAEAKEDLMCDMFQLLTPDRSKQEPCDRHHGGSDVSHQTASTSKRRLFRSASSKGDSNFYSMFTDESDIFM